MLLKEKSTDKVPPKVKYSLNPLAVSLIQVLLKMRDWGVDYEKGDRISAISGAESIDFPEIAKMYTIY